MCVIQYFYGCEDQACEMRGFVFSFAGLKVRQVLSQKMTRNEEETSNVPSK